MEFLDTVFLGNTIRHWAIAIAVMLATIIVLRVVRAVLVNRMTALAKRTATDWDDIITAALAKTSLLFVLVVGVVVGMQSLTLSALDVRFNEAMVKPKNREASQQPVISPLHGARLAYET